jgi:magnesium transporter
VQLRRGSAASQAHPDSTTARSSSARPEAFGVTGARPEPDHATVTSWAAIIAVPTAVPGYYGMNVPYPGVGQHSGVATSTVLLVVVLSGGLDVLFKRLGWL